MTATSISRSAAAAEISFPCDWMLDALLGLEAACNAMGSSGDVSWCSTLAVALLPHPADLAAYKSRYGYTFQPDIIELDHLHLLCRLSHAASAREKLADELMDRARFMVGHEFDDPTPVLHLEPGAVQFVSPIDETLFWTGRP